MGIFDAFNNSLNLQNNSSPFGEAGLLGDPLHYLVGDKYDNFMRKTWEYPNQYLGDAVKKYNVIDRKINPLNRAIDRTSIGKKLRDLGENKPGDTTLAVLGSIFGGGALLGGGAAGGGGGSIAPGMVGADTAEASSTMPALGSSLAPGEAGGLLTNSGLGAFANGGVGGMAGIGGGNAGSLAASQGISGGAGFGSASPSSMGLQDYLKMAQSMNQQQQQPQPQPVQPVAAYDNSRERAAALIAQLQREGQAMRSKVYPNQGLLG